MHDCPECGEACYCDGEDHDIGEVEDCNHNCDHEEETEEL